MTFAGLGIVPSWQFLNTPDNPKFNPNVVYPAGVTQTTTQPIGPWLNGLSGAGVQFLGPKSGIKFLGPAAQKVELLGFRGFGDVTSTVSSIGSFLVLALAVFGGYSAYKKFTKK